MLTAEVAPDLPSVGMYLYTTTPGIVDFVTGLILRILARGLVTGPVFISFNDLLVKVYSAPLKPEYGTLPKSFAICSFGAYQLRSFFGLS